MSINANYEIINNAMRVYAREGIAQDIEKFNEASNNMLSLSTQPLNSDFGTEVYDNRISGLIGERTPYTDTPVTALDMTTGKRGWVKVHRQLKPVNIDPQMFTMLQQDPARGAVTVMNQAPGDMMQDMLNTGIGALVAAMAQTTAMVEDGVTNETDKKLTHDKLARATTRMGDAYTELRGWLMHSLPFFNLYRSQLANGANLFDVGNVRIMRDPLLGTPIIVTDSPQLINLTPTPDQYRVLGLTEMAVEVQLNNDLLTNVEMVNGQTNIKATIQSEYSFNIRIKGYGWDSVNGGKAPTNAALFTATNWDKFLVSDKFGPGVILNVE